MMEIRISLNEYADIPFIKKLLSQIKGISDIEMIKDNEMLSDKENEEIKDLFEFNFEDFTLENYNPYPGIKAPVAV